MKEKRLPTLVQEQIILIKDPIVKSGLEKILVEPTLHLRNWDYGVKGEQFECWTVAIDHLTDTSIVYSEFGHGPKNPWGFLLLIFGSAWIVVGLTISKNVF